MNESMTKSTHSRIEDFLATLRTALNGAGGRPDDIVEEVRADLIDLIDRHRSQGASDEEAVSRALQSMGDPHELAHHVRREVPPFGGLVASTIRYALAGVVIIWTLLFLWNFRALSYGAAGLATTIGVALFHLPVVLLLWPRMVWRKNWLFGLIPAGIAFVVALFLAGGGVTGTGHDPLDSQISHSLSSAMSSGVAGPEQVPLDSPPAIVEPEGPSLPAILAFGAAVLASGVLLVAMQQVRQRRWVIVAALIPILLVEIPFQIEESFFRREVEKARAHPENGGNLNWGRPLYPSAFLYLSADGRIRVQD
jgi:hypothetical protein